jgi:putative DNA primase/helicase
MPTGSRRQGSLAHIPSRRTQPEPLPSNQGANRLIHETASSATDGLKWRDKLLFQSGRPVPNLANAITALEHAPEWSGVLAFDAFALETIARRARPWDEGHLPSFTSHRWTDHDTLLAANWLQHQGINASGHVTHDAISTVAKATEFHPIRDYLNNLKWDGVSRIGKLATEYFGAADSIYASEAGLRFMISAVARAMLPGCKVDHVLILEGPQGSFKSTAASALAGDAWFTDELAELGSKDAALQLRGRWIIEMAELNALGKSDIQHIKAFLSRTTDRFRPPYGRVVEVVPRQCVFIGTTNAERYLK